MVHLRRIPVEGAGNVRDLGGYAAADGTVTKWNALYRSATLFSLTPIGWDALRACGVRTLIDLRSDVEAHTMSIDVPDGFGYIHNSLMKQVDDMPIGESFAMPEGDGYSDAMERVLKSACVDYGEAVRENIQRVAEVLDAILVHLDEGGVLFFCSAGKDRTGIIAALCLTLAGVSREDIVADYMVSTVYNKAGADKMLEALMGEMGIPDDTREMIADKGLRSDAQTMEKLLDELDEMDIGKTLDSFGFGTDAQERLSAAIREGCV